MTSNDNKFKRGHRRTASTATWSKAQPVTDLLLNLPSQNMSTLHLAQTRDTTSDILYLESPPIYFELDNQEADNVLQKNTTMKIHEKNSDDDDDDNSDDSVKNHYDDKLKYNEMPICLNCTRNPRSVEFIAQDSAINAMCSLLCNENCQKKLTLEGLQLKAKKCPDEVDHVVVSDKIDDVATTLAKVSAMTSTIQMKQRLAARKLEIELDQLEEFTKQQQLQSDEPNAKHKTNNDNDNNIYNVDNDLINKFIHSEKPTRELLLYFLRMGSFNSAPKINNVDSQDDNLEIPKSLSSQALLDYMKRLRGERHLPLLNRQFTWPEKGISNEPMVLATNDLTDGFRCLKIDSLTRGCSAPPTAPNQIRLLQWNMLSQTLGQSNDNFVCCPDEALTWEYRKYLIVEEILQHSPDIICLQEVDHFKFLQSILSTLNYEGVFYPKPDSPCLYIEDNNGPDGCAIFYRRDRFELKRCETRILEVWRVQSNQVAIAVNLLVKGINREICVATTHLKARHGTLLAKLRNEQGRDLLQFVKQCAGQERPLILCGDFNAEPIEPVYTTIMAAEDIQLGSAYADYRCHENEKPINVESEIEPQDNSINDIENETDAIESSIRNEPPYTTWKIREDGEVCHTIDYVFYTKNKLNVKNCLDFPNGTEIGKLRTPSYQYPSDHFSLVCDFEIPASSSATANKNSNSKA